MRVEASNYLDGWYDVVNAEGEIMAIVPELELADRIAQLLTPQ